MPINMHANQSKPAAAVGLKTLSAAVFSAVMFMSGAHAAGMGKLTVLSALGQPLRAEIELTSVAKDEAGALTARLAPVEAYRQANIDLNPALLTLRFAIEQRGGRQFVRITSTQPINEPFVDLLLELGGGNSRLLREYTFLLDPAELRTTQPAQVAAVPAAKTPMQGAISAAPVAPPAVQARPAAPERAAPTRPASPAPAATAPASTVPAPSTKAEARPDTGAPVSEYRVKKGDSLAGIANRVKPEGVSLDQMLVALYRANGDAFVEKNMNRLRTGEILSVPGADAARSIPATEARGVVVAQAADFNSYRNKLAAQVAGKPAQKSADSAQSASGKITTKIEESATDESKDKLKLSKAGTGAVAGASNGGANAATEDRVAKDKALNEANARVKDLEKNLADLQKLLEIKNKELADQQKQASLAKAATPAVAQSNPSSAGPVAAGTAKPDAAVKPAETPSPARPDTASVAPAASEAPASAPVIAAAPVAPVVKTEAEKKAETPPPVVAPKPAAKTPAPAPEPGFLESLSDNPMLLPGGALLLVVLGALGIYSARRKKKPQFEDSILTDSSMKANSLFGSTGGQSIDTNNSVFNSSFTPSASQLDTNEVDPVAEADVYIAYGRDAQAEEILKEALRTQPERHAVRLKLLEIYANRKDTRSFEILASELYGMTKGEGDDWKQAAILGLGIDPANPLYGGGKLPDDVAAKAATITAPTQPLDFDDQPDALSAKFDVSGVGAEAHLDKADESLLFANTIEGDKKEDEPVSAQVNTVADDHAHEFPLSLDHDATVKLPPLSQRVEGLDFNLDEFQPARLPVDEPVATVGLPSHDKAPTLPNSEFDHSLDFGTLSFDDRAPKVDDLTPTLNSASGHESGAALADAKLKSDDHLPLLDEPLDFGFKLQDEQSEGTKEVPASGALPSIGGMPAEPAPAPLPAAMDFDLSSLNLDLGDSAAKPAPSANDKDGAFEQAGNTTENAEMSTKLDLAAAYQEIGDKEGARELLDEVLRGGSPKQVEEARTMLVKLA